MNINTVNIVAQVCWKVFKESQNKMFEYLFFISLIESHQHWMNTFLTGSLRTTKRELHWTLSQIWHMPLSYMTYLSLYHYIIKIVFFQIRLNFLYIFFISMIFWYGYSYISFIYTPLDWHLHRRIIITCDLWVVAMLVLWAKPIHSMSYMTYLSLYHYIIKIVLFQIRLNFLYIFFISMIFWYGYGYI